jgi:hypothetical protein
VLTSDADKTTAPFLVLNDVTGADKAVTYPAGFAALYGVNVNAAVTSAAVSVIAPDLVLKVDTPDINAPTWAITNAVDASCVVLVPIEAVGVVGTPVNIGDTKLAGVYPSEAIVSPAVSVIAPVLVLNDATDDNVMPDITWPKIFVVTCEYVPTVPTGVRLITPPVKFSPALVAMAVGPLKATHAVPLYV